LLFIAGDLTMLNGRRNSFYCSIWELKKAL
jgi:hypothetical protein